MVVLTSNKHWRCLCWEAPYVAAAKWQDVAWGHDGLQIQKGEVTSSIEVVEDGGEQECPFWDHECHAGMAFDRDRYEDAFLREHLIDNHVFDSLLLILRLMSPPWPTPLFALLLQQDKWELH